MRIISVIFAAVFSCVTAFADLSFITGESLGGAIVNSTTAQLGFKFVNTSGTTVTVTKLGRWVLSGNNQTHALSIYDSSATPVQLATVTVNCSGATTGAFLYGTLGTPYNIAAGATVYFVSAETNGGDTYYDFNGTVITTTNIGSSEAAYIDTTHHDSGNSFRSYVPVSFQYSAPLPNWTKSGTVYTTDGSQYSVNSAIQDANPGDTVNVPAGTFTWGAGGTNVWLKTAITLQGAGPGSTTIVLDATGPSFSNGGVFFISTPSVVQGFTVNVTGTNANHVTAFNANTLNGWRITNVVYSGGTIEGYFLYPTSYGLVDSCTITGNTGAAELVQSQGPINSWQTPNSMGTANAVYVEACTINNMGYVCDANSNARMVIRFCTINGDNKVDGHGLASNTPPRSFRQIEVYDNNFNTSSTFIPLIEIRGGTGRLFNNASPNTSSGRFFLTDYGYQAQWPNFGNVFQTPNNYPIGDQVGTGQDVTIAATAITNWEMVRIATVGTTDFTLIGSPNNSIGTQFIATGPGSGTGTATHAPSTEPIYVWSNTQNGSPWPRTLATVAAGASAFYGSVFTEPVLIQNGRDFFADAGFDGTAFMQVGTTAAMNAYTPATVGYGWWVTDQGSWNTTLSPNTSGLLYRWNGSAWVLLYTPYTYPHPLRGNPPTLPGQPGTAGLLISQP